MKQLAFASAAIALGASILIGCSHPAYYPPAPPPPPPAPLVYSNQVPPLIQIADRNGFQAGYLDGSSDAYYHAAHKPRQHRAFKEVPGYDPRLGPFPPYVDAFRTAYLRGYDKGFFRR
jgi:hypothetical protein